MAYRTNAQLELSTYQSHHYLEDNQATIEFSNHNLHHAKSKHIQQCYHYTRESVKRGHITLAYVPTSENLADIMTKPLPPSRSSSRINISFYFFKFLTTSLHFKSFVFNVNHAISV